MDPAASEVDGSSVRSLDEDIRALFEECLSKVRHQDSLADWKVLQDRLGALRERIDQAYGEAPCTYCGANRPTTELKIFEFRRRAALLWRLCDQCWKFLVTGFNASHHRGANLQWRVELPLPINEVEARSYINAGMKLVGRHSGYGRAATADG
jgi:hypothetical protein